MTNDFRALPPGLRFLGTFTGGMLLSAIAVYGLAPEFPTLARENRPLENLQVALLLIASLLQVWWANTLGRRSTFERTVAILLAYLCLACASPVPCANSISIASGTRRISKPSRTSCAA